MLKAPINLDRLNLFTDGNVTEEKELVKLFLEQAEQMVVLLEQSTGEAAQELWKCTAHRFKGSASNLGAEQLQHLCERAEMTMEVARKLELIAAIKREMKTVEEFFMKPRIRNLGRAYVSSDEGDSGDEEIFL